ncbi:FG-GAP-like repeat-containing protein [Streptomyces sp. NPDC089919]|uniref:FG-GAP-like repeat-containing protein n=1 Tax=Streptomyces sp. NPDC089919 TaxID=3155188 RepID=UPI003436B8A6
MRALTARRAVRWAATAGLALAVALPAAPPAGAAGRPAPPTPSKASKLTAPTSQHVKPTRSRKAPSAEEAAAAEARRTGKPVPIPSLTTETDTVVARPAGGYALTRSAGPVRVKQHGRWVPLDATLVRAADGTWAPRAALAGLALSPGGTAPMARMTARGGGRLALSWPTALPRPVVRGATATYREVLPGVDLAVTAVVDGGFTQVLVVKTREAAKNPAVARYRLRMSATGVTVRARKDGTLAATDAKGRRVFSAPAATMWDSSRPAAPKAGVRAADAPPAGLVRVASDTEGPGAAARTAKVAATPSGDRLTIAADTRLLTDPKTVFPVFIDPAWKPDRKGTEGWTWVQEGCPGATHWNDYAGQYDMGVGNQRWATNCRGREHTFVQTAGFDMTGKTVNYASFNAIQSYAADNTCANTHPVDLYWTAVINSGTNWTNQPGNVRSLGRSSSNSAGGAGCSGGTNQIGWDITQTIRDIGTAPNLTFGMYGGTETSGTSNGFKRYTRKTSPAPHQLPFVYIEYNTAPNIPGNAYVTPAPKNPTKGDCGWIGQTNGATGGVGLHATVTDPDAGDSLDADFNLWDITAGTTLREWGWVPNPRVPGGSQIDVSAGSLIDGHQYDWYVRAGDGLTSGGWARGCSFTVDLTAPSAPSVTSADFPATGTTGAGQKTVGATGAFALSATDPGGAGASGLLNFEWSLNGPLPANGAQTVAANASGGATLNLPVDAWGTNVLRVRGVDRAGNRSREYSYVFYAPDDPQRKTVLGDIDKDGYPDLLVPDATGNLRLYSKKNDPALGGVLASDAANGPGGGWTDVDTTHRGGNGSYADDLWAHRSGAAELYLYMNTANNGGPTANDGQFFTPAGSQRYSATRPSAASCTDPFNTVDQTCGASYADDWSKVRQVLAIGDVDGTTPGTPRYDLLTVEDDGAGSANLWLFKGTPGTGALASPRLIGKGGWTGVTLAAPGDTGSVAGPADGLPDLWVRDSRDGRLYQYLSRRDGDGKPVFEAYGSRSGTAIQTGLTDARHHRVSSDGDGNGDGRPDLWSLGNDGRITTWDGKAADAEGMRFGPAKVLRDASTTDWNTCRTFTHADTGAHKVCGPILAKYLSVGGTDLGYPSTDTTPTPDRYGWYGHFKVPGQDSYSSIYWSPDTGAHVVWGAIRTKWAGMGWENGYLGFPSSDEYGQTNGARSDFEGGYIRWSSTDYKIADYPYGQGEGTARVSLAGDFNGDGLSDLATIVDYGSCGAAWWTHLGSRNAGLAAPFESGRVPQGWWCVTRAKYAAGDFNGDGRTDIAALYVYADQSVKVMEWLARPDGGFAAAPEGWSQAANWDWGRTTLMAGDTDGDHRAELIGVYGYGDGRMANYTWKFRDATGFDAPVKGFEETHPGWWWYENAKYAAGDVNGDGRTDIIALYVYGDNSVRVFTGMARPDGSHPGFNQSGWSAPAGSWQLDPVKLTAGDTNGDGRVDLTAQYRYQSGRMGVYQFPGGADGSMGTPEMTVDTGYGAWDVNAAWPVSGDENGDGRADMSTVYDYGNGSYATFTFLAGANGKYSKDSVIKSWTAPAGTW